MGNQFNPGDLVKLKSGGPTMTVEQVRTDLAGKLQCVWFKGTDGPHTGIFFPDAVTRDDSADE